MPLTASSVRTLSRELTVERGEDIEQAMHRVDRSETAAVCRHLLAGLRGWVAHVPRPTDQTSRTTVQVPR